MPKASQRCLIATIQLESDPAGTPRTMTQDSDISKLPPPDGKAVSSTPPSQYRDPWLEQARRKALHEAAQRRRRLRWAAALGIVVLIAVIAAIAYTLLTAESDDGESQSADTTAATQPVPRSTAGARDSEESANDLVTVDEVWLVDRGDGIFDWGVVVLVPDRAPTRSGVEIEVRLIDADNEVVATDVRSIDGVDTDSPGAAIGQVVDPDVAPVRIEFDVAVGRPSNDVAFDEVLQVQTMIRDGDELSGRVRSSSIAGIGDVAAVFVWREDGREDGDVIGMAIQPIDEIRPGVDARFVLDLTDQNVPDGRPDDVFWVPQG